MSSAETHIQEGVGLQWTDICEKPNKEQIGGDHYNNKKIQPIDYIIENCLPYCEGNVVKYVTRHKEKNGAEDIRKAIHYLRFILASDYGEQL